ncbi:MAG: hypothetical protein ACRCT8_08300 [Lacipirellulaceae bacterium]
MAQAIFCTAHPRQAEVIIQKLQSDGFSGDSISVLMSDKGGTRDFAHEHNTKAPEGIATGGSTGAIVGGALGWMAGIGALAIPGLGPFIAAGPIMAALGGATVGGALGGLTGGLIGMGIPEFEAKQYEGRIKTGSALISVHAKDSEQATRVRTIFEQNNAEDITAAAEVAV